MRRRTFLAALALSAITGCVAPSESGTTSSEPPATAPTNAVEASATPHPDDPILFVVHNLTESDLTVSITLTHDGTALIDETVALADDEAVEYDPEIHTPGEYTLTVAVDGGPRKTRTLPLEQFDIGAGSNHYVEVYMDEIQIFAEE